MHVLPGKISLIAEFRLSTQKVSFVTCGEAKILKPLDLLDIHIIISIIRLNSTLIT